MPTKEEKLKAKEEKAKLKADKKAAKQAEKDAKKGVKAGASVDPVKPVEPVKAEEPVIKFSHINYEGGKILAILPGGHTASAFHCRMSDGTTKHVPKDLFE